MSKQLAPELWGEYFLEQRWAGSIVAASILVALIVTLYPYDFYFADAVLPRFLSFDEEFAQPGLWGDAGRNVLLFMPLGFGVSCYLVGKQRFSVPAWIVGLICGALLSAGIEFTQVLLPVRQPAVADIISNGLGAMLGALTPSSLRRRCLYALSAGAGRVWGLLSARLLGMFSVLYLILFVAAAFYMQRGVGITNWDTEFPLMLGNERTGDRPWSGEINELVLLDQAVPESEVSAIFSTGEVPSGSGDHIFALVGRHAGMHADAREGLMAPLIWRGDEAGTINGTAQTVRLGPTHWLETSGPASFLSENIEKRSAFTILLALRSENMRQGGPGRILSISDSPGARNLTIGQDGSNLVVRLRTPVTGENGNQPSMLFPGVFTDTRPHTLLITYKPPFLRLYIDGTGRMFTAALTPEMTFIRQVVPVRHWRQHVDPLSTWLYSLLNYAFVLLPLAFLLALFLARARPSDVVARIGIGAVIAAVLLLEEIAIAWGAPRPGHILLSIVIIAAGTVCFGRWVQWILPATLRRAP